MATDRGFDALGFAFDVASEPAWLAVVTAEMFVDLGEPVDVPLATYRLRAGESASDTELWLGTERVAMAPTPSSLVLNLAHDVNHRAISQCPYVVIHAGGVVSGDVGIALPGVMEAGKSTLTAGLVRAGLDYISDEAVAVDPDSLVAVPYAKPLSIDPGAWSLFPETEPSWSAPDESYKEKQWQVPATSIRPDCIASDSTIGLIVFPRYVAGAPTGVEKLTRGEALVELAKNTFGFDQRAATSLDVLADVVRSADCYRLQMGDLPSAVSAVQSLIGHRQIGS